LVKGNDKLPTDAYKANEFAALVWNDNKMIFHCGYKAQFTVCLWCRDKTAAPQATAAPAILPGREKLVAIAPVTLVDYSTYLPGVNEFPAAAIPADITANKLGV
jgi:hypothetical protein